MIVTFAMQSEHWPVPVNRPPVSIFERARLTIASVRKFMPNARIVQLSNERFPKAEGVDEVLRLPNKGDFIKWAFCSLVKLLKRRENVLQIATDIILTRDVSDIFDLEFDIAACRYPLTDRWDRAYCGDVNFIKPSGAQMFADVLDYYRLHPMVQDGWEGGQTSFLEVAKKGEYKILELPYDVYCRTPEQAYDDVSDAAIVHFRGLRKAFMPQVAAQFLESAPA